MGTTFGLHRISFPVAGAVPLGYLPPHMDKSKENIFGQRPGTFPCFKLQGQASGGRT